MKLVKITLPGCWLGTVGVLEDPIGDTGMINVRVEPELRLAMYPREFEEITND